jgi:hypothetical protein
MRVVVVAESPTDALVVRTLTSAVLGKPLLASSRGDPRNNGWDALRLGLPATLLSSFADADVAGVIVVGDVNGMPIHSEGSCHVDCRHCLLSREATRIDQRMRSKTGWRRDCQWAVSIAAPAIEGWLSVGTTFEVTESHVSRLDRNQRLGLRRQLKLDLGLNPTLASAEREARTIVHAQRVALDLDRLARLHPNGFGLLRKGLADFKGL